MIPGVLPALALLMPVTMSGGLRLENPDDAAPAIVGVLLDTRVLILPDAYVGAELTYGGGWDDRNPEVVRVMGKGEIAASLGWRPILDDTFFAEVGGRIGLHHVDGWARGALPSLMAAYGPVLGAEAGVGGFLVQPWGHPFGLELRAGYDRLRIDGAWVGAPVVGLFALGQLLPEPGTAPD